VSPSRGEFEAGSASVSFSGGSASWSNPTDSTSSARFSGAIPTNEGAKNYKPSFSGRFQGGEGPGDPTWHLTGSYDIVEVEKVQYKIGDGEFEDCPDPLIVLKGTEVTFKAIRNPSGSQWPIGKPVWSGTSGITGQYETKAFTFNTLSTSSSDYKTVIAECGLEVTVNVLVCDITLEWVEKDSPLDENPNSGEGKRIFPGKQTQTDSTNREKVTIRASITPKLSGKTLFFKVFDIDDPYTNDKPIDTNGSKGGDNRGGTGTLSVSSASTDSAGKAESELTVTLKPGDNFRIGCDLKSLSNVSNDNIPANNEVAVENQPGRYSKLLTVWRKLHIEVDLMTSPLFSDNTFSGTWSNPTSSGSASWVWLEYYVEDDPSDENTIETDDYWSNGGVKLLSGGTTIDYSGISSSEYNFISKNKILIKKSAIGTFTNGNLVIGDDDFYNGEIPGTVPATFKAGVVGTSRPISSPNTTSKNFVKNAYKDAYIDVAFYSSYTQYFKFYCNCTNGSPALVAGLMEDYDDKQNLNREEKFWTVTTVILFQPNEDYDNDPHGESALIGVLMGGTSPTVYNDIAVVFNESCHETTSSSSEFSTRIGQTMAHEICHCYTGIGHASSGIMTSMVPSLSVTSFAAETLVLLRNAE
jgi:hypothetical protein